MMDLSYGLENEAFRLSVREFLAQNWRPGDKRGGELKAFVAEFRRQAVDAGYLYRGIPKRYGGSEQAADVLKAQVIRDEFTAVRAPMEVMGNGVNMLVPTLLELPTQLSDQHVTDAERGPQRGRGLRLRGPG